MFEMNIAMNKVKMKYLKEAITIGTFIFFFFSFCVTSLWQKSILLCNNKGGGGYVLDGVTTVSVYILRF